MKKVLIANRGEIAVRIARACADHGVASVAVYADPDIEALHVAAADQAYGLDGVTPADTYLNIDKLLAVARDSGADAVHPGYGFLSESAAFAQAVIDAGLVWIGPPPAAIECLGDKVRARHIAAQVGAPMAPGTSEPVKDASEVLAFAREHGLPVAIKAAFGGGGRGIKVAWHLQEIEELYESAVREAVAAFGRGECFLEKFLDRPRHVEVQVLADLHGKVAVLGTRDCSLQRRNQKLVEEAPAPFLTPAQREQLHQAAHDICRVAGYAGAGTVEFLLSADGTISFLEVNTRLQVEHPVTEETTGIDLVIEQLCIAAGEPLRIDGPPAPRGHAFEFRINAEDAARGFLPTPGPVHRFDPPSGPGVRLDSGVATGSVVPGNYDSMMAKLIVTGATREQALARARRALREFRIEGVASVLPFHRAVIDHPDFNNGEALRVHTRWIETEFAEPLAAALRTIPQEDSALTRMVVELDGKRVTLGLPSALLRGLARGGAASANGDDASAPAGGQDANTIAAPVAGTLQRWQIEDGASVAEGDLIAVIEAMKMEVPVRAPRAGKLGLAVQAGAFVAAGAALAWLD